MNLRDIKDLIDDEGENRGRVAIVAGAIVVVFILIFVIVINVVHISKTPKIAGSSSATTIAGSTASTDSVSTNSLTVATTSTTQVPGDPEGEVVTSGNFALKYPEAASNLDDEQFKQATKVGTAFVTADTTGAGKDAFSYYYTDGHINTPWVKDLQLQWIFAKQDADNVIEVQAWYGGTSLVDGQPFPQAEQDFWLDMKNNDQVIQPENLINYGISYDPVTCCTYIKGQ